MPPSARIPPAVWEAQRERIASLYVDQDKTLDEVIQHMAEYYSFHASKAQYIRKVTVNWKLRKNSTKDEWERASALVSKRKAEGKATQFMMNGKIVSNKKRKKEMKRYPTSRDQQIPTLMESDVFKAVVACTPPSSDRMHISFTTLPSLRLREILEHSVPVHGSYFGSGPLSTSRRFLPSDHAAVNGLVKTLILAKKVRSEGDAVTRHTIPEPQAILNELTPTQYDPQTWPQPDESPWLQLFHSLVFLSTNNMLERLGAVDQFLKLAISNGFLQDLKQLLIAAGPTIETFATHLLFSSLRIESKDSLQLLRFLLQIGISPNSVESHGNANVAKSALQVAVQAQNEVAVELLLNSKADPNKFPISLDTGSPLNLPLKLYRSNSTIVQMLIDAGANVNFVHPEGHRWSSSSLLIQAVENVDLDCARRLLRAGTDPNLVDPWAWNLTELHYAVFRWDLGMLDVLIEVGADPNILCRAHNLRLVIEERLRGGRDFPVTPIHTPIQEAFLRGNIAIVKRLIDAGAILENVVEPDLYNDLVSPFLSGWKARDIVRALFGDDEHDVAVFVSIIGANDCARHRYLPSLLQVACGMEPGEVKRNMVEFLLSQGADINTPPASYAGRTTLQAAAQAGDYDLVEDLLTRGAKPSVPGAEYKGLTALQAAVVSGCIDVVELLLSSLQRQLGLADARHIWQDGTNYFEAAAKTDDVQMLDVVFRSMFDAGYQCSDEHVASALRAAVKSGSVSVVQRLLDATLDADIEDHACSIICEAIWNEDDETFDLLMDQFAGVDLNITCPDHSTPLWAAVHAGQESMAQRLIEAGANVDQLSPHMCPPGYSRQVEVEPETPMQRLAILVMMEYGIGLVW